MAPHLTAQTLAARLRWPNVTERAEAEPGTRLFTAWPAKAGAEPLDLVFDASNSEIIFVGFGPWWGDFERSFDERRNTRLALAAARAIIAGARCVLAERGEGGLLLAMGLYRRRPARPPRVAAGCQRLNRYAFNAAPTDVETERDK